VPVLSLTLTTSSSAVAWMRLRDSGDAGTGAALVPATAPAQVACAGTVARGVVFSILAWRRRLRAARAAARLALPPLVPPDRLDESEWAPLSSSMAASSGPPDEASLSSDPVLDWDCSCSCSCSRPFRPAAPAGGRSVGVAAAHGLGRFVHLVYGILREVGRPLGPVSGGVLVLVPLVGGPTASHPRNPFPPPLDFFLRPSQDSLLDKAYKMLLVDLLVLGA